MSPSHLHPIVKQRVLRQTTTTLWKTSDGRLYETYKAHAKASADLIEKLIDDEDAQLRAVRRANHFNSVVEDLLDLVEERIWDLCTMQQHRTINFLGGLEIRS